MELAESLQVRGLHDSKKRSRDSGGGNNSESPGSSSDDAVIDERRKSSRGGGGIGGGKKRKVASVNGPVVPKEEEGDEEDGGAAYKLVEVDDPTMMDAESDEDVKQEGDQDSDSFGGDDSATDVNRNGINVCIPEDISPQVSCDVFFTLDFLFNSVYYFPLNAFF